MFMNSKTLNNLWREMDGFRTEVDRLFGRPVLGTTAAAAPALNVWEDETAFYVEADLPAWIITALWLLHPLQTESVTYVVQRAESLMGFFYLGAFYCFARGWSWATVGLALLAMALPPTLPLAAFDGIVSGFCALSEHHRMHLAGGNLTKSPGPLMIDVTVIGTVKRRDVERWSVRIA